MLFKLPPMHQFRTHPLVATSTRFAADPLRAAGLVVTVGRVRVAVFIIKRSLGRGHTY